MPTRRSYRLIARTGLDDKALCAFLEQFKAHRINIQKLVLVQSGNGARMCDLELVFVLPEAGHPFLAELKAGLAQPGWFKQELHALG